MSQQCRRYNTSKLNYWHADYIHGAETREIYNVLSTMICVPQPHSLRQTHSTNNPSEARSPSTPVMNPPTLLKQTRLGMTSWNADHGRHASQRGESIKCCVRSRRLPYPLTCENVESENKTAVHSSTSRRLRQTKVDSKGSSQHLFKYTRVDNVK